MKKVFWVVFIILISGLTGLVAQEIPPRAFHGDRWNTGKILLESENKRYQLVFYNDGTLAVRNMTVENGMNFWHVETKEPDSYVTFQEDGNLVIYKNDGTALWSSNSYGKGGDALYLMNTGNLVIHAPGSKVVWESGKYWVPNRAWMPRDGVWKEWSPGEIVVQSENGHYRLIFQEDGNLVLYHRYSNGNVPIWDSGTYNQGATSFVFTGKPTFVMGVRRDKEFLWRTDRIADFECLYLDDGGNMVVHAPGAIVRWETGTAGK